MDLLKELLGFVVLTGPLFLLLIWLPIAIWLANKFVGRLKHRAAKIATGIIIFSLLFLLPFVDEIIGKIYLKHLCATQAGVEVFQTVELPAEFWDESGRAKFINARGVIDVRMLGDRFHWGSVYDSYIDGYIKVDKRRWQLKDHKTGKVLGVKTDFIQHPGWLVTHFFPGPGASKSCPNMAAEKRIKFFLGIFIIQHQFDKEDGLWR